jgi:hypothetical protein
MVMGKIVKARYDAEHQSLRLLEPIEGLEDQENVEVTIDKSIDPKRPWLALSGVLDDEAGESFARAVEEMFPIEK